MNYEDNIHIAPQRQGMTYIPELTDDATGEPIEGTDRLCPSHLTNWQEQSIDTYEEVTDINQDALNPDDQDPEFDVRLAETFDEINTTEFEVNPTLAYEIATADIGNSRTDAAVQLLTAQVYNGELTAEEAFQNAVESGLNPDDLMRSYYKLKEAFS